MTQNSIFSNVLKRWISKLYFFGLVFNIFISSFILRSQSFSPAPGVNGSIAIKKDSPLIQAWANGIELKRGFLNITKPSLGLVSFGVEANAISDSEINSNEVVSFGDSGVAIVTFNRPIENGIGADFVVFENGFNDGFIELAFVEVSSDGTHFFRFPAISEAPVISQIGPFDYSDCRYFYNLAGNFRIGYGTPFDLEEMKGYDGLDINRITHVKLIDVIGSIDPKIGSKDKYGTCINDLFPTEFPSGGFDLDAVGVIHQGALGIIENQFNFSMYPNPTNQFVTFNVDRECTLKIMDPSGKILFEEIIGASIMVDVSIYKSNVLYVNLSNEKFNHTDKIIVLGN